MTSISFTLYTGIQPSGNRSQAKNTPLGFDKRGDIRGQIYFLSVNSDSMFFFLKKNSFSNKKNPEYRCKRNY